MAGRSEDADRGRWPVNGLVHCGGGKAPPIRPDDLAEAGWAVSGLACALKSGVMPDGDTFGSGMGEVVRHGTQWLTDADRTAMAVFLLDTTTPAKGN